MNDFIDLILGKFIPAIWPSLNLLPTIPIIIIQILIGNGVRRDVKKRIERNYPVFLFGPWLWFFIGSVGVWGILVYWLIHYSSIQRSPSKTEDFQTTSPLG